MSGNKGGYELELEESGYGRSPSNQKSTTSNVIVVLVIVLLLAVIILTILVAYLATTKTVKEQDICLSSQCAKSAAAVLNAIDFSVNPCENFYDFACGGWMKRQAAPSYFSTFNELRDEVAVTLKYLLEEEKQSNEIEAIVKIKDLYHSCFNLSLIEERGMVPIINMITEFGGWPLLGNRSGGQWNESTFDLSQLLVKVMKYYRVAILNFYVFSDLKNSNDHILYLEQPGFGMARKYILSEPNSTQVEAYTKLAKSVALALGADVRIVDHEIDDLIALERELANITIPGYWERDVESSYNKYTIGQLRHNFTESKKMKFSWEKFIRGVFDLKGVNMNIDENEPIIVKDPHYFEKMSNVLDRHSKRTVANYVVWLIVKGRLWDLPNKIRVILNAYKKSVHGFTTDPPRWKSCAKFVTNFFGHAIGRLFIEEKFDKESKDAVTKMIVNIKNAFKDSLDNLDWIDESTKMVAREKCDVMKMKIGYEDFILDDKKLNRKYQNYTVRDEKYFENVIGMLNRQSVDNLNLLRRKVDKDKWDTSPTRVNAYYRFINGMLIPAGILQPPYYHKDQPQSLNYGGIGFMIGHEITHGFDDVGRQYDKNGDVKQWWDNNTIRKFKARAKCFVEQYGNFSFPEAGGMKLDGELTLGENIADNGGIKQCYMAYRQWVSTNGREEPRLPGVNLTHDQLLFLNIAQQRCSAMNKQTAIDDITTRGHSPARFRIIGSMQNYKEFSKVFDCPVGSYMNPARTCEICGMNWTSKNHV